jgi:hypothetical protein
VPLRSIYFCLLASTMYFAFVVLTDQCGMMASGARVHAMLHTSECTPLQHVGTHRL